ncbi:hypothetical protein G6O43_25330, partial [Salmonella enterica subsp. enterica serovar 4:-:1,2]|nr:hypothetical protein [Salmonella enterica subsp. enterica serovar 4:-:1,2]
MHKVPNEAPSRGVHIPAPTSIPPASVAKPMATTGVDLSALSRLLITYCDGLLFERRRWRLPTISRLGELPAEYSAHHPVHRPADRADGASR